MNFINVWRGTPEELQCVDCKSYVIGAKGIMEHVCPDQNPTDFDCWSHETTFRKQNPSDVMICEFCRDTGIDQVRKPHGKYRCRHCHDSNGNRIKFTADETADAPVIVGDKAMPDNVAKIVQDNK